MNDLSAWTAFMHEVTPLADQPHAETMFLDLLNHLRVGADARSALIALLRQPWRRYHGAGHVGLLWDRHLAHGGDPTDAVAAHAIAYHDAVYAIGARDNEARSAELWYAHAAHLPDDLRDKVAHAILATADHAAFHTDPDACWLVDLDLTPLGEPWPQFLANGQALRVESGVVEGAPIPGQTAFLRRLLALPRIYRSDRHDDAIANVYEASARINLLRLLAE